MQQAKKKEHRLQPHEWNAGTLKWLTKRHFGAFASDSLFANVFEMAASFLADTEQENTSAYKTLYGIYKNMFAVSEGEDFTVEKPSWDTLGKEYRLLGAVPGRRGFLSLKIRDHLLFVDSSMSRPEHKEVVSAIYGGRHHYFRARANALLRDLGLEPLPPTPPSPTSTSPKPE